MKRILMLGTGGTIASASTADGLVPQLSTDEILGAIPSIARLCHADALQVCNIDSTNILPSHWLLMEAAIEQNYDRYDGFVVCHGTDTMAYTAAALSYLVQGSPKPIVITGSQKPLNTENTDSRTNLYASFTYASSACASGVVIVFDGRVIPGTRARKVRSKSFDAFMSINYPELASVRDGRILSYITLPHADAPRFCRTLSDRVALLKLIPGTDPEVLDFLLSRSDAVIIESYGVGGLPQLGNDEYLARINRAAAAGKTIVMTTQVQLEGSDIGVYQVGHALKSFPNILEAYDMTTEAVVTKLMWILGQTHDPLTVRQMFYTPVAHDLLSTEVSK